MLFSSHFFSSDLLFYFTFCIRWSGIRRIRNGLVHVVDVMGFSDRIRFVVVTGRGDSKGDPGGYNALESLTGCHSRRWGQNLL